GSADGIADVNWRSPLARARLLPKGPLDGLGVEEDSAPSQSHARKFSSHRRFSKVLGLNPEARGHRAEGQELSLLLAFSVAHDANLRPSPEPLTRRRTGVE